MIPSDLFLRLLEPIQPMFQSLGVVQTQILNIQHRIIPGLEYFKRPPQRRSIGAREDPFSNPAAETGLLAAANEMQQPPSGIADRAMNNLSELRVSIRLSVFQTSD